LLRELAEPDPLDVRAREVSDALAKARDLLGELQAEVTARSQIIEDLAGETRQAEQRAQDAAARAGLTEKEAEAVDALLISALKQRLGELKQRARRREWSLATVVALIVGVVSILIAHLVFGF
jgi:predicted  nucleic acid-binding Zn-ribbon protein